MPCDTLMTPSSAGAGAAPAPPGLLRAGPGLSAEGGG